MAMSRPRKSPREVQQREQGADGRSHVGQRRRVQHRINTLALLHRDDALLHDERLARLEALMVDSASQ